jgi:16S rRNA (cytosine967-C5)-methyltransferase
VKKRNRESQPAVSPARAAAFDILLRIERDSSYAGELLHSRAIASMSAIDHSLATELVMGVLRWQTLLDAEISQSSSQPLSRLDLEILIALRLAVYQLRWLSRIPARAAIHESVELVKRARKRSAAPFVNAVLRKLVASTPLNSEATPQINGTSTETLAVSAAHPLWLVERWAQAYGLDAATQICCHNQSIPVTAIRLRDLKAEEQLRAEGIELAPGALLASARRVLRGDITSSTAFRSGKCAIQDEASQLVAALVGHGTSILDCCAAPGGKTLAMADRNADAQITAIDLHAHRARLLQRLLRAQNLSSEASDGKVGVVAADARQLPFAMGFDRVLADVPCSGTGTLSRNPEIKWRLTPKDLSELRERQIAILRSAMARVAVGGRIVYSTCSLEREENEDVIERALGEGLSFRVLDCSDELEQLKKHGELIWDDPSTLTRGPFLRTLPGVHPCDGFFAAILERI